MTVGFIDDHRDAYEVEPIYRVVRIAPSTYHRHRVRRLDPTRRSARAQGQAIVPHGHDGPLDHPVDGPRGATH